MLANFGYQEQPRRRLPRSRSCGAVLERGGNWSEVPTEVVMHQTHADAMAQPTIRSGADKWKPDTTYGADFRKSKWMQESAASCAPAGLVNKDQAQVRARSAPPRNANLSAPYAAGQDVRANPPQFDGYVAPNGEYIPFTKKKRNDDAFSRVYAGNHDELKAVRQYTCDGLRACALPSGLPHRYWSDESPIACTPLVSRIADVSP